MTKSPARFPQLSRNLKELLAERYGDSKVAEKLADDMGISERTAYRWIGGETVTDLDKLARHLGVPESRLLHEPLPAIVAFVNGAGAELEAEIKSALLSLTAGALGTSTPRDETLWRFADYLELDQKRRRNHRDGDQS